MKPSSRRQTGVFALEREALGVIITTSVEHAQV